MIILDGTLRLSVLTQSIKCHMGILYPHRTQSRTIPDLDSQRTTNFGANNCQKSKPTQQDYLSKMQALFCSLLCQVILASILKETTEFLKTNQTQYGSDII